MAVSIGLRSERWTFSTNANLLLIISCDIFGDDGFDAGFPGYPALHEAAAQP